MSGKLKRLNLGCGTNVTVGWENYDNSPAIFLARHRIVFAVFAKCGVLNANQKRHVQSQMALPVKVIRADVTTRLPLGDGTAEVVYSSHMLEHLDRMEARVFLHEVRRVLAPGGILRLVVPDIKRSIQKYAVQEDADSFVESLFMASPSPKGLVRKLLFAVSGNRLHKWMYDGVSLCKLLIFCGFVSPTILPAGSTTILDPGPLDLYERADESVYVEASKP